MFLETRTIEQYRYERKFLVSKFNNSEIENIVKMHPSFFSKAYESRFVNNIYMEFNNNKNYFDSVEGACDRLKVTMIILLQGSVIGSLQSSSTFFMAVIIRMPW